VGFPPWGQLTQRWCGLVVWLAGLALRRRHQDVQLAAAPPGGTMAEIGLKSGSRDPVAETSTPVLLPS
jgi:hypothetical protein